MHLTIPKEYDPKLSVRQTQEAIRYIRETFQDEFVKNCIYPGYQHRCLWKNPLA